MKQTAISRFATLVGTLLVVMLAISGAALAATTPLAVTKTVPTGGATEVARTVNAKAYFNHDMKASTITSSTFKIRKQGTTTWLSATRSVNNTISPTSTNGSSQSVATLNPNSDLAANTTYQVVVVGGSSGVKDTNGNALGANKSWTFTTVDTIAPAAPAITSPQENGFVGASFTLSGTAEPNATVEVFEGTTSKGTTQTGAGGNWSKALSGVADGSHTYTAKATDAAGNVSAVSSARTLTVDTTPPTVNSVSPADTATGVTPNTNVTATFSEPMNAGTVSDQSFTLSKAGSTVSAQVTYDQTSRTATLDPAGDLQAGATYDAKITTSVKDSAGNGLTQEKTWSFTVEAPPPVTVSPDPLDFGSACLTTVTKSVTITNNTASQVDLSPSVTSLAFSVASDELHIAAGQSTDLPISWTAGGAYKQTNTGSLELKNASGNVVATSGLKAFVFCPIDG
jgi:hypothetical protein